MMIIDPLLARGGPYLDFGFGSVSGHSFSPLNIMFCSHADIPLNPGSRRNNVSLRAVIRKEASHSKRAPSQGRRSCGRSHRTGPPRSDPAPCPPSPYQASPSACRQGETLGRWPLGEEALDCICRHVASIT